MAIFGLRGSKRPGGPRTSRASAHSNFPSSASTARLDLLTDSSILCSRRRRRRYLIAQLPRAPSALDAATASIGRRAAPRLKRRHAGIATLNDEESQASFPPPPRPDPAPRIPPLKLAPYKSLQGPNALQERARLSHAHSTPLSRPLRPRPTRGTRKRTAQFTRPPVGSLRASARAPKSQNPRISFCARGRTWDNVFNMLFCANRVNGSRNNQDQVSKNLETMELNRLRTGRYCAKRLQRGCWWSSLEENGTVEREKFDPMLSSSNSRVKDRYTDKVNPKQEMATVSEFEIESASTRLELNFKSVIEKNVKTLRATHLNLTSQTRLKVRSRHYNERDWAHLGLEFKRA
ncbi:hypothetical protein R3P38DRAFT_2762306 [Favolaschia claudopus]|uniref:Uncharacterized protein n=1 Tax=Favolaschia claudopus TaxID=2862362 RepID=A0AAW0DG46_9AGAR